MELERTLFDKEKTQKRADWLLKLASDTGMEIPEEMRREVEGLEK